MRAHERVLDFRSGTLSRSVEWVTPGGQAVAVRSVRMVSLVQRAVAAVSFEVEALDTAVSVVLQSELVANEVASPGVGSGADGDPRTATVVGPVLVAEAHDHHELRSWLMHRTAVSGLRMAAAMDHRVEGPAGVRTVMRARPIWPG